MAEKKEKPERNRGDTMMEIGVLMVVASILLPIIFDIATDETTNLGLLLGGLALAVVGWSVRSNLRKKAKRKNASS